MNDAFADTFRNSPAGRVIRVPRGAATYWAFVPNDLPPRFPLTDELFRLLSDADRALGELSGIGRFLPNPNLLIRPYLSREAVLSSQIEGTRASLSDVFFYEAAESPKETPLSLDIQEVLNYVHALEYGLRRLNELPLSLRLIRELHGILMEGVRGEHASPGEFRRTQNWIGPAGCSLNTATFVPPPPESLMETLGAWERFLHTSSDLPPLIQCALMHAQFETIHPFLDGNGRIGRLLITLFLCEREILSQPFLYLSAFFERHRREYYEALDTNRTGEWERWLRLFLRGVAIQSKDAVRRTETLLQLHRQYQSRARETSHSANLTALVDHLFESPVVVARQVAGALGVTFQTGQNLCQRLLDMGILRESRDSRHPRVYIAHEILTALEEEPEETD